MLIAAVAHRRRYACAAGWLPSAEGSCRPQGRLRGGLVQRIVRYRTRRYRVTALPLRQAATPPPLSRAPPLCEGEAIVAHRSSRSSPQQPLIAAVADRRSRSSPPIRMRGRLAPLRRGELPPARTAEGWPNATDCPLSHGALPYDSAAVAASGYPSARFRGHLPSAKGRQSLLIAAAADHSSRSSPPIRMRGKRCLSHQPLIAAAHARPAKAGISASSRGGSGPRNENPKE